MHFSQQGYGDAEAASHSLATEGHRPTSPLHNRCFLPPTQGLVDMFTKYSLRWGRREGGSG